jgi:hypothetical protein
MAVGFVLGLAAVPAAYAKTWVLRSDTGIRFTLSSTSGRYHVSWRPTRWSYRGQTAKAPADIQQTSVSNALGKGTRLTWNETGVASRFSVTLYPARRAIVFSASHELAGARFPAFTRVPQGLLHLSLEGRVFTPPQFQLADTATPWVFFNRRYQTCIFAPASEILVSRLYGDGIKGMADGFNKGVVGGALKDPHQTIMIFGRGIRRTVAAWGDAFRVLHHRPAVSEEATPILRDFGYWTDNGASYFYNYDPKYGYAGTLLKMASEFRRDHIHLGYMELDSWWYEKSDHFFNGRKVGPMNPHLPQDNRWNHFGGTWLYHASHQLFPKGLDAFHHQVGLPLVVHARWIARHSPYHKLYRISGIAAADRAYWKSRAEYLAKNGVRAMEQDWLIDIYGESPQLHIHLSLARDFAHGMADALAAHHIATMYCMETGRFLMEAGELPDVIAMRGADDRFLKARWRNFIYTSMFIHAVGAWPWSDVFMSREPGNMLLSLLSGGPVGVGDPLGHMDVKNIDMVTRADGRLVKPSVPLMPTDQTMVNDALGRKVPLVATTHTGRQIRTTLVFVYRRRGNQSTVVLTPHNMGLPRHGVWIAREYFTGRTVLFTGTHPITVKLAPRKWTYWVVAPLQPSRIAFFGDLRQMVPTGHERIMHLARIRGVHSGVGMQVVFAAGEKEIPLTFYSYQTPEVLSGGRLLPVSESDRISHFYQVMIPVKAAARKVLQHHKVIHIADVIITVDKARQQG